MEVRWNSSDLQPAWDGEYFVILEALENIWDEDEHEEYCKAGEIAMGQSHWASMEGGFPLTSSDCPAWRVIAWAPGQAYPLPDVPQDICPKLRRYFSKRVKWTGDGWLTGAEADEEGDNG